jgi:hypothetical protein
MNVEVEIDHYNSTQDQPAEPLDQESGELARLRSEFQTRLLNASLRAEAILAGMVDLDGLKLLNLSDVHLDENDSIIGGRSMMDSLKAKKPWLFRPTSSSSAAIAPSALPVRHKTALDMTDEEYAAARAAVIKY